MTNEEILQTILSNYKTIVAYCAYPTYSNSGNVIAETNDYNGRTHDELLRNFITLFVQLGASVAGYKLQNKSAVKVKVDGLDYFVYFRRFDKSYSITTAVKPEAPEIPIQWEVGY